MFNDPQVALIVIGAIILIGLIAVLSLWMWVRSGPQRFSQALEQTKLAENPPSFHTRY